jgi:hypothetical protein
MKNISYKMILKLLPLILFFGCELQNQRKEETDPSLEVEEIAPRDGENIQGHYQAKFMTMNPHINGTVPGSANFFRKEEKFFAFVRLFAGGVKAWHMQNVYNGGRCPSLSDDTNGDGFIDIQEAQGVMGKILIPLDSDINTQDSGKRFFPLGDLSGNYHYERVSSFRKFLSDLQSQDKDPEDDIVKLTEDQGLNIVGKTVLIQGVSETVELPETVGTKGRHRSFQTLPVACGIFKKIDQNPGNPYIQDEIPGPVSEVVDDQDQPSEEENEENEEDITPSGE